MSSEYFIRLKEFVDRTGELERFCEILSANDKLIMIIWGDHGIGKTSLLARLMHECGQKGVRLVRVARKETESYDYLALMRKIRDGVGKEFFEPFTDLVNYFTVPDYQPKLLIIADGSIKVAERMQVSSGSKVGDVTGVKVEIKDFNYQAPRPDREVPEEERMYRLTELFLLGLAQTLQNGSLTIFIDDMEYMTSGTRRWFWQDILKDLQNRELSGVKFVLGSRDRPSPEEFDRFLQMIARSSQLQPLDEPHVLEYLEKRDIPDVDEAGITRQMFAKTLMKLSKGHPQTIANLVDTYLIET